MSIEIKNCDCFELLEKVIEPYSVHLFLLDLPYGQTDCQWDNKIDLKRMWAGIKRTMKPNATMVFFCTTKFGYELIASNPTWFKYDLVWEKNSTVGFLNAQKMPLRAHEMVYIFSRANDNNDIDISRNLELRKYSNDLFNWIGKPLKELEAGLGYRGLDHFVRCSTMQFGLCTRKSYDYLIENYNIRDFPQFKEYDELKQMFAHGISPVYNPQKTYGHKVYKSKMNTSCQLYNITSSKDSVITENDGSRHPKSILKYDKNVTTSNHPTEKPLNILEFLIKSYSNAGDLVCDFCAGSGSAAVACKNTGRAFIGSELNKEYYEIALNRVLA